MNDECEMCGLELDDSDECTNEYCISHDGWDLDEGDDEDE